MGCGEEFPLPARKGDAKCPALRATSSRWAEWRERRERPVLPVGARRPADKAREGGAPTGRTGPGVFRPKRNDEPRGAGQFSRDASPLASGAGRGHRGDPGAGREPRVDPGAEGAEGGAIRPPLLLARECHGTLSTGCLPVGKAPGIPETPPALSCLAYLRDAGRFVHGRSTACGGARVSAESGQSSRWGRGTRLTRRVREEPPPGELARVYFDRNATQSAAKRRGSGGMDRRSNAAWVSPQAVNRRTRRGR